MEKCSDYLKKNWIKCCLLIIVGIVLAFLLEKGYFLFYRNVDISRKFSFDRFSLFLIFSLFVVLHFVISPKKIWDFIYRKRYVIGIVLFGIIVLNGYHGSSISTYNHVIQPNNVIDNEPFLGYSKSIRSDEFLVDTPGILSQVNHNDDFQTINDAIMARKDMTVYMFPQLPTKSISILSNPKLLGFLFLPEKQAFSFFWYFLIFVCFFATFELAMIITKGNKLYSVMGASLIAFSPVQLWWGQFSIWTSGCCAILFFRKFLQAENTWKHLLFSILFGYAGSVYIMCLYPAWLIPFGYLFLGLLIWQLYENKDKLKLKLLIYLLPCLVTLGIIILPAFIHSANTIKLMGQTVYPGAREAFGGNGSENLFNYLISPFFTVFKAIPNASESSQSIGLYPIPILLGIFYAFRNFKQKNNDFLLNILIILALGLVVWNYFEIPIFAKITMLTLSTPDRSQIIINIICILIILRIISGYEKMQQKKRYYIASIIIALCFVLVGLNIVKGINPTYVDKRVIISSAVLFVPLISLLLWNIKQTNKIFCFVMIAISLGCAVTIQPISKGLSVMHEKPFAKEVKKILKTDKEAKWVMVNASTTGLFGQSYLLANGARVINSTNYYPNLNLWENFDIDKKNDKVYNRYAHIAINITNNKTAFTLLQEDLFNVSINKEEVYKLGAKYYASNEDLSKFDDKKNTFKCLYNEDGMYIFELIR